MSSKLSLGEAARASLSLPPDAGLRLRSMAAWLDGTSMPPPPALRPIDKSQLEATMKAHREMAEAMLSAEIAAKASTDAPRKALVATLSEHASRLGFEPLALPARPNTFGASAADDGEPLAKRGGPSFAIDLSSVSKSSDDGPAHVRDEYELVKRRSSTVAVALALSEEDAELRLVFDRMDKDANGHVDGKEWGRAMSDPTVLATLKRHFGGKDATKEEVGRAFQLLDVDASGSIDWEVCAPRHTPRAQCCIWGWARASHTPHARDAPPHGTAGLLCRPPLSSHTQEPACTHPLPVVPFRS